MSRQTILYRIKNNYGFLISNMYVQQLSCAIHIYIYISIMAH